MWLRTVSHFAAYRGGMRTESAEFLAALPRKRMGSGALFVDESDRILLVEPTYKDHWEFPGGVVEADESPYATAVREIQEELGMAVTLGPLLVFDWIPPRGDHSEGVMLLFDGGVLTARAAAAIELQAEELRSWAWSDDAEIAQRLPDFMTRRALAARRARNLGATAYLEYGFPVG